MYTFAYLFGLGVATLIWGLLFYIRKDQRHEQIFISVVSSPLGPISQILWFSESYWRPEYLLSVKILGVEVGVEEALFGFLVGGISSTIYQAVFRKQPTYGRKRNFLAALFFLAGATLFYFLTISGINPIWASSIALITTALVMMIVDRTLKWDMLFSGILMLVVALFIYFSTLAYYPALVERFFVTTALSGINVLGIPIEELVWFFSWGMFAGILYEFWRNAEFYQPFLAKNTD